MNERDPSVEYRDIPGFTGYQAGSDGSLWSAWAKRGGLHIGTEWKKLKQSREKTNGGRFFVNLGKYGIHRVHNLIALAFLGPRPEGQVCRHFPDPTPTNNRANNLRYGTQKENMDDCALHGNLAVGEKHGMARFTKEIVLAMRADHAADPSEGWTTRLATKYGTDPRTVHRIITRQRWKHV